MDNQNLPPTLPITEPVQNPTVENQPLPPALTSRFPKKVLLLGIVISIFIISLIGTAVLFLNKSNGIANVSPDKKTAVAPAKKYQAEQWVPCDDVRQVLEENGTLYVGCNGGLLIVEKATGKVIDQISMAQGLPDPTVTEFIKNGDMLHIGTQYGLLLYNLKTKEGKKLIPEDGLVNGSNIKLALQGDTLWIGTFDGVSRYNLTSGAIKNYKSELGFGSHHSTGGIFATPDAIYVSIGSNAESTGGVARFDFKKQQWELQSGVDGSLHDFTYASGNVYLNGFDEIFLNDKRENFVRWNRLPDIKEKLQVSSDSSRLSIIGQDQNGLYILTSDKISHFNPSTGDIQTMVVPPEVFVGMAGLQMRMDKDTFWYKKTDGWIGWINLKTNQRGDIQLANRPIAITGVAAVIDGQPLVTATDGVWEYESVQNKFTKLVSGRGGNDTGLLSEVKPLLGTSKALIYTGSCAQGCGGSLMYIYDFFTKTSTPVEMNIDAAKILSETLNSSVNLRNLSYKSFDSTTGLIRFTVDAPTQADVTLDSKTLQWNTLSISPTPTVTSTTIDFITYCNPVYFFKINKNIFSETTCLKDLENDEYTWEVLGDYSSRQIKQIDKKTKQTEMLTLPLTTMKISPFSNKEETTNVSVSLGSVIGPYLWLVTSNGVMRYSPVTKEVLVVNGSNGLPSNEVTSYAIDKNTLWVTTLNGGLAKVILE